MKTIKNLLLLPLVLIAFLLLTLGFLEGRKAYWDNKVQKMCDKDGGTTVFEYVTISRDEALRNNLTSNGLLKIPLKSNGRFPFIYSNKTIEIRSQEPRVYRGETKLIRVTDGKTLAIMVEYLRVGGDFPSFSHSTSQNCLAKSKALADLNAVVRIKEDLK